MSSFNLLLLQPPVLSTKSPLKSPVKRRSGLFPRLHSSTETPDKHTRRLLIKSYSYYYILNINIVYVVMQADGVQEVFMLLLPLMCFFFLLFFCSDQKLAEICPLSQEVRSETSSNPSSPEICPNKDR